MNHCDPYDDNEPRGGAILWLFISLVIVMTFFIRPLWFWVNDLLK